MIYDKDKLARMNEAGQEFITFRAANCRYLVFGLFFPLSRKTFSYTSVIYIGTILYEN